MTQQNEGQQFDRLPAVDADRLVPDRATRQEVLAYFHDRFGIPVQTFESYTFWEKGKGKIWAFHGAMPSPIRVEALGIHLLRTRQLFWKPTTDGMQVFGDYATKNTIVVAPDGAAAFWNGESQSVNANADDGYVIVTQELLETPVTLGVGLYLDGELRSVVPKSRQRAVASLSTTDKHA